LVSTGGWHLGCLLLAGNTAEFQAIDVSIIYSFPACDPTASSFV